MLRWGWYEEKYDPLEYWYCLDCDRAGREPCIQVFLKVLWNDKTGEYKWLPCGYGDAVM